MLTARFAYAIQPYKDFAEDSQKLIQELATCN